MPILIFLLLPCQENALLAWSQYSGCLEREIIRLAGWQLCVAPVTIRHDSLLCVPLSTGVLHSMHLFSFLTVPLQVGTNAMDSTLLKYSAKDYFFKAALCHFCVDMLNAKVYAPLLLYLFWFSLYFHGSISHKNRFHCFLHSWPCRNMRTCFRPFRIHGNANFWRLVHFYFSCYQICKEHILNYFQNSKRFCFIIETSGCLWRTKRWCLYRRSKSTKLIVL